MLEKALKEALKSLGLKDRHKYALAVSGGVDSVALLVAATKCIPKENLVVLHFNHLTRGKESSRDEAFVTKLAHRYGLKIRVAHRQGKKLDEANLRKERLKFFKTESEKHEAYVLLAHHLEDQLETFLIRFIRGAQLKGLMGMRRKNGKLIRPFLSLRKSELKRYLEKEGVGYREDSSNLLPVYFRNRIRQKLLPVVLELSKEFGGEEKFFKRFQLLVVESQEALRNTDKAYDLILKKALTRSPYFDRLCIEKVPLKLRRDKAFTRRLFEKVHYKGFDKEAVKKVSDLINRGSGRHSLKGREAEVSCGFLYLQSKKQRQEWQKGPDFSVLRIEKSDVEIAVRSFEPGDRFRNQKIKREFLKLGIPRLERRLLPLVLRVKSKEVLWFLGLPKTSLYYTGWDFPHAHLS